MKRSNMYNVHTGNEAIVRASFFSKAKGFVKEIFSLTTIASSIGFALFDNINAAVIKKGKQWLGLVGKLDNTVELLEKHDTIDPVVISQILSSSNLGIFSGKYNSFNNIALYYETINLSNGLTFLQKAYNEAAKGRKNTLSKNVVDDVKKLVLAINPSNSQYFGQDVNSLKPIIVNGPKGNFIPLIIGCSNKGMVYDKKGLVVGADIVYNRKFAKPIKCNFDNLLHGYKSLSQSLRKLSNDVNGVLAPLDDLSVKIKELVDSSNDPIVKTNLTVMLNYYILLVSETAENLDLFIMTLSECGNNIANQ
ncbi:MAG: hypothetical protein K2M73_09510 [Lachnospiraceae bacterium]|nr:hypothetical protein [Lachnospiraceae bacterium]